MAQQDTEQQHSGVLPVDDEGFVIDTEDCEEREAAHRERGVSRPITVVGNPVLHKECKDVTEFGDDLRQLVADMFASQRTAEGVGLAANQIGVDKRIFVLDCAADDEPSDFRVFINPEILEKDGQIVWNEGCLSFPGVTEEIKRAEHVKVRALDRDGKRFELEATGLLAVAIQHETDHLNGVLMIDKLSALKKRMMGKKLAKARDEAQAE